jgi:hypothetical protein
LVAKVQRGPKSDADRAEVLCAVSVRRDLGLREWSDILEYVVEVAAWVI